MIDSMHIVAHGPASTHVYPELVACRPAPCRFSSVQYPIPFPSPLNLYTLKSGKSPLEFSLLAGLPAAGSKLLQSSETPTILFSSEYDSPLLCSPQEHLVLVAYDSSAASRKALSIAVGMCGKLYDGLVIIRVAEDYVHPIVAREEADELMKSIARGLTLSFECRIPVLILYKPGRPEHILSEQIGVFNPRAIVIGKQGAGQCSSLGRVADHLIRNAKGCVMVVDEDA
ncbi:uncharacterized protein BJ171DRAFT_84238 [Polychytrium aggregatum]|uniref:uncharacterized protein n=1 Tax=Polychytrium aggregatum TaxID=110093 RepID=UPI0022FE3C6A|nr:uncharacterized protein BJ171DRAFT_84238 [Polychytrium aggregatum]KAI9205169.1 hypothetical protein BJ171DRAFT_84238 [Polychytrium aggregatum]